MGKKTRNETAVTEDKIYIIRGQQVMLSADSAEIYGYDHKGYNKQIKNNNENSDEDFRFRLTIEEMNVLRRKNDTANISPENRAQLYVFTEQGIYILMDSAQGRPCRTAE